MEKQTANNLNTALNANEPKLNKGFLIYEGIYILICVICKFFIEANVMYESILMGVLSVISMAFVITQIIMRKKRGFRSYMTNLFLMGLVTVAVMIWCIEGFV